MVARGGMCGCSGRACMVAPGGGHVWLLLGGMCGCSQGGRAWLLWGGTCMVASRGACMVAPGGACMVAPGGVCVVAPGGGHAWFFDEIWSMSGRYASYWNAFLYFILGRPELCWNCSSLLGMSLIFTVGLNHVYC